MVPTSLYLPLRETFFLKKNSPLNSRKNGGTIVFYSCSKRYMTAVGCRRSERAAKGYGLGVLRIERGRENGFNAEEEAKK